MNINPYFRIGPRVYYAKGPRAGCFARTSFLLLAVALSAAAFVYPSRACGAQVSAAAELRNGVATVLVGNPSPRALGVTIELFRDATPEGGPVTLGAEVDALVSPAAFTLQSGEVQTVRIKVREAVAPGEVLRLATTYDPSAPELRGSGARLVVRTRLVTKVQVAP